MKINQRGIDFIKQQEGLRLSAYPDPGTKGNPWTIGYGHTGLDVRPHEQISEGEALRLLSDDIRKSELAVEKAVHVPLTDYQFSALVSFVFNVGEERFKNSTLLRYLNNKNYMAAASELPYWNKVGGVVMLGLAKRRRAEFNLFMNI